MSTTLVHLSTILTILLLQGITTVHSASCSTSIAYTCNTRGISATQRLTLTVTDHDDTNYDATIIFHWQGIDNNLGSKTYVTEQGVQVADAHTFGEYGTYFFGYTVQYGEDVGCADRTRYYIVSYPSSSEDCFFDNYEGSNVPTRMISDAPTTLKPTNEITPPPLNIQPPPTPRPTIKWDFSPPPLLPVPNVPSDNTNQGQPVPTTPTTPVPTMDESQSGGTEKTLSPTDNKVRDTNSPTTPAPIIDSTINIPPPNTPTISPTIKPISSEYNQTIRSTMVLLYSDILDDVSKIIWTDVTEQWITDEVVELTGNQEGMVHVDVDIIQQNLVEPGNEEDQQNNIRRKLQSTNTDPLTDSLDIQFQTTIVFPQSGTYEYDMKTLVSSGFDTVDERQEYIKKLQDAGAPDYFTDVSNMLLSVDGTVVQAKPNESTDPVDPTVDPDNAVDNGNTESEKNSVVPIVAGVVGGVLLIAFIMIGVYYNKRRNQQQEGKDSHTTQDSSGINNKTVPVGSQGEVESTQPSPGENETGAISLPEAESYFGTIEATRDRDGFDDVSTLGDPYMGDAVAVVDADNTVGESTVRSEQQEYYGAGGKRIPTGIDSIMSSRFGGSTIGSNRMMFSDDPTLEDIYDTPEGNKTEEDASFERISVEAPAGMLGIVLDNPRMDLPIVYAIKETSALHGKVRVGDLLLNVDEIDCRGMSAHQISTFLSSRSKNPTRRLILARGTGIGTTAI